MECLKTPLIFCPGLSDGSESVVYRGKTDRSWLRNSQPVLSRVFLQSGDAWFIAVSPSFLHLFANDYLTYIQNSSVVYKFIFQCEPDYIRPNNHCLETCIAQHVYGKIKQAISTSNKILTKRYIIPR